MAIQKLTVDALADNTITDSVIADDSIDIEKLSNVNLNIAPEILEIQVDAPDAGQDTMWKWTWLQSTLPYARRTITNSPEVNVPLYKQGTYTVNNFAAYDIHGSMTQTHSLYLKWVDGAGTDNLVSWATSAGPISDTHPDINSGNATDVQRISVNVPSTITPPSLTNPSVSYTVVNSGSGSYTFSGAASGDNPNLGPFYRGGTYTINITASGHPFYFTTDNGTNFAAGTYFGEYTSGVTGSRTDSGTITFTVPAGAPDTLYYQCGNHSAMRGAITVKDLAVETNINGNYVVYFQHTQEGHKTPIELRPIPSLVNQMCIVYDASSGQFVPQDLSTYVENTPSFENKIREVAGTAELVVEDGSAVVAKVNVYADSTYLPLVGNNAGDQAFATDTDKLYIWDGSAWQLAGAASTDELAEGSTNLYYTNARADARIAAATTTDLTEGTNLYFTNARADARAQLKIDALVGSAPGTLDTLQELGDALGDDPNFATTVTNSIATKLALSGGTLTGNLIIDPSAAGAAVLGLERTGAANQWKIAQGHTATDYLEILEGSSTRLTIKNGGNVGIGYDNPASKLDVRGELGANGSAATPTAYFVNNQSGATSNSIYIGASTGIDWKIGKNVTGISNNVNFSISDSSNNRRFDIDANGRVGIGTASPSRKLTVLGVNNTTNFEVTDAAGGNTFNIYNNTTSSAVAIGTSSGLISFGFNGIDKVHFKSNGNVGIGTSSPARQLSIVDDGTNGQATMEVIDGTNNNVSGIFLGRANNTNIGGMRYFHATDHLALRSNDVDALIIDSTGKVGVGRNPETMHPNVTDSLNVGTTSIFQRGTNNAYLGSNMYYEPGGDAGYSIGSGYGLLYQQNVPNGDHIFSSSTAAASAGANTLSFSENMRITGDGKVGINNGDPQGALSIHGTTGTSYSEVENLNGVNFYKFFKVIDTARSLQMENIFVMPNLNNGQKYIHFVTTMQGAMGFDLDILCGRSGSERMFGRVSLRGYKYHESDGDYRHGAIESTSSINAYGNYFEINGPVTQYLADQPTFTQESYTNPGSYWVTRIPCNFVGGGSGQVEFTAFLKTMHHNTAPAGTYYMGIV